MWPSDIEVLSTLVTQHLLLSKVATRHDLKDPETISAVCAALGGDPVVLDVLHALTEADSLATGPGVWSDWKASLVGDLVRRCRLAMAGEPLPQADPIDPEYVALAADGGVHVQLRRANGRRLYHAVMIAPDQRGLLSKAAGVLALNSLRVHSASVNVHDGAVINDFMVSPQFGPPAAEKLLRQQLITALNGDVDVLGVLEQRGRDAARAGSPLGSTMQEGVPVNPFTAPPRIQWFDGTAPGRMIVELRAADRPGLLALLTGALERAGVDIVWAKVATLGSTVDDVFCVVLPAQAPPGVRAALERDLYGVLESAAAGERADRVS
jgi:[protein-PII] uridylyltransferase